MPQVRASWPKLTMAHAKQLPDAQRAAVWAAVGDTRRVVRDAPLLAWIDAEVQVAVSEGLLSALGNAQTQQFWHSFMLEAFGRSLLKPVRLGARALYGGGTLGYLRMAPRVHDLVARGCGEMTVEGAELDSRGSAIITVRKMPALLGKSEAFSLAWWGAAAAVFDISEVRGETHLDIGELGKGSVRLDVEWSPRR
ncbi:MAG: hypothetical protein H6718_33300 [Polyangiaceae bacterium]|nr:hypothetical protein [Myxococcales bacterium]MCB9590335.1 hypothetical protein [Polyangiaceae bacterium]MCB9605010.1 hypothetical protein [Polyangiaceae bacterium]